MTSLAQFQLRFNATILMSQKVSILQLQEKSSKLNLTGKEHASCHFLKAPLSGKRLPWSPGPSASLTSSYSVQESRADSPTRHWRLIS